MKSLLLLFAKPPVLGTVKTRLAVAIGNEQALWVYEQLLAKTVSILCELPYEVAVFYHQQVPLQPLPITQATHHLPQYGENLGARMHNAFQWGFDHGYGPICVLGTDLWSLTPTLIHTAFKSLQKKDVVIGPASDGGYYLLGLNKPNAKLFENISWSTDQVLTQTQALLESESVGLLPIHTDIDTFEDLQNNGILYRNYLTHFNLIS